METSSSLSDLQVLESEIEAACSELELLPDLLKLLQDNHERQLGGIPMGSQVDEQNDPVIQMLHKWLRRYRANYTAICQQYFWDLDHENLTWNDIDIVFTNKHQQLKSLETLLIRTKAEYNVRKSQHHAVGISLGIRPDLPVSENPDGSRSCHCRGCKSVAGIRPGASGGTRRVLCRR